MVVQTAAHEFEQYLSNLRYREEQLLRETQEIREQIGCAEVVLEGFLNWRLKNPPTDAIGRHNHVQPNDIAHCPTQRAALEEIARLSGGLVNATDAARVIVEVGKWSGNLGSVGATVYKIMNESKDWEWVEPGVFRLLVSKEMSGQNDELPDRELTIADNALDEPEVA